VTDDAARWARLEQLFDAALDQPAATREDWVRHAAGDDPVLLGQLQRMLAAHDRPGVLDARLAPLAESDVRDRLGAALAERYELGEALGSGGAATVFRARERKHDRSVVLKVLQPSVAAIIGPARFAEEVRIAARLAHPHILPLIDSGEADGLRYYVMPYVGGETLRERLREGPLSVANAITLLRDIADALAHAHAAGVVHRDLKPENVLCVGGHAFLLDFGVAQLETDVHLASRLTDPGIAIGTPGYMAPEQAAGEAVDHRADIYAWGLLAREILTGSRDPGARLADRSGMPPTLIALIGATLALDPAERPAGAGALVAALDGMVIPVRARRARWPRIAAVTAAVVLAGWFIVRRDAGGGTLAPGELLQPVAVAPFRDETGDAALEGIGRLAADWITQGLHESGELRVVAWPAVRAAVERAPDGDAIRAIREAADAGTIILGRIYRTGDELRLSADIVDARRGIVLAAPRPVIVPRDSSLAGVRELRDRVLGALAVQRDPRLPAGAAFANRPPTHEAYLAFDRALSDYDAYRYAAATAGMLEAWQRDTTFTAALVYAAFAASNATDQQRADSLVHEALARRTSMSAYHAAMSDHLAAFLRGDGPGALEAALRANELAPGSRAGYNAARTLLAMNRPAEAEALLASLDPEHGPMRGWPAYWSQRAYAAHLLGHHEEALAFAREMHRRHPEQRVTTVLEARALASLGRRTELDSLFRAAEALPPEVYWSQGAMRTVAAEELMVHGDTVAAMAMHADAERWLRGRLARAPEHADHRFWLATALIGQRKWRAADAELTWLLRTQTPRLRLRGMAALVAAHRGDRARAERLLRDAAPDERGEWLAYRARLAAIFGEREDALRLLGEAIATGVRLSIGGWHWVHGAAVHDFAALGDDPDLVRLLAPVPPPTPTP
jgi:serine/threonine-protein kinase